MSGTPLSGACISLMVVRSLQLSLFAVQKQVRSEPAPTMASDDC